MLVNVEIRSLVVEDWLDGEDSIYAKTSLSFSFKLVRRLGHNQSKISANSGKNLIAYFRVELLGGSELRCSIIRILGYSTFAHRLNHHQSKMSTKSS